jgi:SAM-dependent methyltransferase
MHEWEAYREENRLAWEARTPLHIHSAFYDLPAFLNGAEVLKAPELSLLPALPGRHLLHLQCHFGMDSLALARRGATVTGLDFSEAAITQARELAIRTGYPDARFICADLYDGELHLAPGAFDLVFTSYGTIGWLPDLLGWARLIARSLKPGGQLIMVDFHPVLYLFDFSSRQLTYPYFPHAAPITEEVKGTYADPQAELTLREHYWTHPVSEILNALIDNGLNLRNFLEWDYSPYPCFQNLEKEGTDRYCFQTGPYPIPHLYGLVAEKTS